MDPDQAQHLGGAIAGFMGVILVLGLLFVVFFIFLFWRILKKAGMEGALSLLILIPGIGQIIVLCILAFSEWKVVPAPTYPGLQPYPPTPPPPPSYPPPPPTQL
jgi:uncharacterized membrane protein YhaH (DUF805 family)